MYVYSPCPILVFLYLCEHLHAMFNFIVNFCLIVLCTAFALLHCDNSILYFGRLYFRIGEYQFRWVAFCIRVVHLILVCFKCSSIHFSLFEVTCNINSLPSTAEAESHNLCAHLTHQLISVRNPFGPHQVIKMNIRHYFKAN